LVTVGRLLRMGEAFRTDIRMHGERQMCGF
jgi:hypothetical protein